MEFQRPWCEATPPDHHDAKVNWRQWDVNTKLSLSSRTLPETARGKINICVYIYIYIYMYEYVYISIYI